MATKREIEFAWEKANKIWYLDSEKWRKDVHGNKIYKYSYGKNSEYGWEIDHKKPKAKKGTNHKKNLQALKTSDNRKKSSKYPYKKKSSFF